MNWSGEPHTMANRHLYIDVTRLLTWQGGYTGMERFAFEMTKHIVAAADSQEVSLCAYVAGRGFVVLDDIYETDGRLAHPAVQPGNSLKSLLRNRNLKQVKDELARRLRETREHKKLTALHPETDSTLLVYDGLWDNQGYTKSLCQLASQPHVTLAHVIHDVVPVVMPHVVFEFVTRSYDAYFKQVAPHIDILVSISRNTERDFVKQYGHLMRNNVQKKITRHGDDFSFTSPEQPKHIAVRAGHFILAVGTVEIRKNYQLLNQVYRLAAEKGVTLPPLVIAGKEGWLMDGLVRSMTLDPVLEGKIFLTGHMKDAELAWLYEHCQFTVFPSLYEGWGLPVAESLKYGKVCAASNVSSIPEIAGDLIPYYSPYDVAACLESIKALLPEKARAAHEKRIAKEYKSHTWQDSARALMGIMGI